MQVTHRLTVGEATCYNLRAVRPFAAYFLAVSEATRPLDREEVKDLTRNYELILVLNPSIGEEKLEAELERVKALVEAQGEISEVDVWGRRKLAYEIQDEPEGYYVLIHFASEADYPKEIERILRISENVLRYLIVLAEA